MPQPEDEEQMHIHPWDTGTAWHPEADNIVTAQHFPTWKEPKCSWLQTFQGNTIPSALKYKMRNIHILPKHDGVNQQCSCSAGQCTEHRQCENTARGANTSAVGCELIIDPHFVLYSKRCELVC